MTAPPRLQLHIGDYLKDTPAINRATWQHHGIYLLSFFIAWNVPGVRLPVDGKWLSLRFGCTVEEVEEHVRPVLESYYKKRGNFYYQKHLSREADFVAEYSARQSARSKAMWEKRKGASHGIATAEPVDASGICLPTPTPTPTPTQEKKEERARATRWPPDKAVPVEWIEEALTKRFENQLPDIDLRLEAEKFANYWSGKGGRDAAKLDWRKTWINWTLNAKTAPNGKQSAHNTFARVALELAREFERPDSEQQDRDHPGAPRLPLLPE